MKLYQQNVFIVILNTSDENNLNLLQQINEVAKSKFSKIMIMGDFNFPHIDWNLEKDSSSNGVSFEFLENLKDTICFNTYYTQQEVELVKTHIYWTQL